LPAPPSLGLMRRFLRQPLTWMLLAEFVVVAALVAVAWHVFAGANVAGVMPLVLAPQASPVDTAAPLPSSGVLFPPSPSSPRLLPGLNIDPAFWRQRLAALNAAETQIEALEWRIVHSALDTMHRYIESVVIPAVEHAEGRGGAAR
jgi:hypothetical protein